MTLTARSAIRQFLTALLIVVTAASAGNAQATAGAASPPREDVYTAPRNGRPDVEAVRRAVNALGTGKKIVVRVGNARSSRARIHAVGMDSFTIDEGQREIAFADVTQIKPAGKPGYVKALIIGGVAFGVLFVVAGISVASSGS